MFVFFSTKIDSVIGSQMILMSLQFTISWWTFIILLNRKTITSQILFPQQVRDHQHRLQQQEPDKECHRQEGIWCAQKNLNVLLLIQMVNILNSNQFSITIQIKSQ